ncbi:MAG: SURF1 family protein [Pseudomonadota bacterium]
MMKRMLFPLLLGVSGAALLIALGVWQVQRLEWKESVLSEIDARINASPVAVPDAPDAERDRFLPVTASGQFAEEEIHVLVSTRQEGAGFRIISPFETEAGRRFLVDRGFVKDELKGEARPSGEAAVTGNLHWPDEIDRFTPEPDLGANIWFARDVPALAEALGTEPVLIVARASSLEDTGIRPLPIDSSGIPNDHLEYAVTWFGLAAVWIAMTALLLWRIRQGRS